MNSVLQVCFFGFHIGNKLLNDNLLNDIFQQTHPRFRIHSPMIQAIEFLPAPHQAMTPKEKSVPIELLLLFLPLVSIMCIVIRKPGATAGERAGAGRRQLPGLT